MFFCFSSTDILAVNEKEGKCYDEKWVRGYGMQPNGKFCPRGLHFAWNIKISVCQM